MPPHGSCLFWGLLGLSLVTGLEAKRGDGGGSRGGLTVSYKATASGDTTTASLGKQMTVEGLFPLAKKTYLSSHLTWLAKIFNLVILKTQPCPRVSSIGASGRPLQVSNYTCLPIFCVPSSQPCLGSRNLWCICNHWTIPLWSLVICFPLPGISISYLTAPQGHSSCPDLRRIETSISLELTSAFFVAEIPSRDITRLGFLIERRVGENTGNMHVHSLTF